MRIAGFLFIWLAMSLVAAGFVLGGSAFIEWGWFIWDREIRGIIVYLSAASFFITALVSL